MASTPPEDSLDVLLSQAGLGDPDAWRQLVERYSRRVYGLLLKQCGDRELSEEITQETFVKVVSHIERYHERGKFEPWLFRIAMNRLRDEMRRRKRHARPMDMTPGRGDGGDEGGASQWHAVQDKIVDRDALDSATPFELADRNEQVELLKQAIEQLGDADREILYLRHTAGLRFAEIAQTLDQPLGTVLARGHRALGKLRKILRMNQDADGDQAAESDEADAPSDASSTTGK